MTLSAPDISVVVPVYNEAGNVAPLVKETVAALTDDVAFEIIIVDDASSDGTAEEIERVARSTPSLRSVRHERNLGQSAALLSGVKAARAAVVVTMDGDGQNDPADIPSLYRRLYEDDAPAMVVGVRVRRRDSLSRRLSSRLANRVRDWVLHDGISDTGCGLKAFRRDAFLALPSFDHMHRFLPALVQGGGGTVSAVPVNHRPRLRGVSKYGVGNRLWVGIVDMLGVRWLRSRQLYK